MSLQIFLIPVLLATMGGVLLLADGESGEIGRYKIQARIRFARLQDNRKVRARLVTMGREEEYEIFRIKQLSYALLAGASALFMALIATGDFTLALVGAGSALVLMHLLIDRGLSQEVKKYRSSIESEFPAIIEMLTLSLSAGESPLGAMTRISQRSHGFLAHEFSLVIDSVRAGAPFHMALDGLGRRVESVVIRRFVDALITAMLRGAPLIDVLARHAAEARQIQRNNLMDKAGKAEISMMVPVVFLILPISILFALWPSLTHLNIFAG